MKEYAVQQMIHRNRQFISMFSLLFLSFASLDIVAKVYTCKDSSGKTKFQDSPCSSGDNTLSSKTLNSRMKSNAGIGNIKMTKALCAKGVENVYKYVMPEVMAQLNEAENAKVLEKGMQECMKGSTAEHYQSVLCLSVATSASAIVACG